MRTPNPVLSDKLFMGGLIMILLSAAFFCLPLFMELSNDNYFGLFIPNFIFTVGYFIALLVSGRLKKGRNGIYPFFLFLILFLISAYSLNREMTIFEKSVPWFTGLLILACVNYIAFAFYESMPAVIRKLMLLVLGIALLCFLYLSFYLFPLYIFGAFVFFALGISLHVFVPLLFTIYTIILMVRLGRNNKESWWYFSTGAVSVFVVIVVHVIQWASITKAINTTYRKATLQNKAGLPGWVAVAQQIPQKGIAEKILKADLVYAVHENMDNTMDDIFWRVPSRNFNGEKLHDPLVMISSMFGGVPNFSEENRIQILESMYDARHQTEERLWSGENLFTEQVKTLVKIWPQFCLSYTEKTITVTNEGHHRSWNNQEEGIYTFNLPEGAVITALSLWIEGKEAKGILTSKQKASTAYRTIVGYERRDPSVVHWQEGNRVSVRVFPVIAGESRMFKIGITAPLNRREGKMVYDNIWFKGPSTSNAKEEIQVDFEQPAQDVFIPAAFGIQAPFKKWEGKYRSNWSIQMSEQPISVKTFSFDGKLYNIRPYEKQREAISIQNIFLDINAAWTKEEFEQMWPWIQDKKVYAYDGELVSVTNDNRRHIFNKLVKQQFSLFPLFEIYDKERSLLITKNTGQSPNIKDLEGSSFIKELNPYLTQPGSICLFSLGNELSPYLKTLKEYRSFRYESGSATDLKNILRKNEFARDIENDQQVVLDNTGIVITRSEGALPSEAPDHLMRLFAYNHIMQQKGRGIISDSTWDEKLVEEAQQAYVVSPVSSLVVLESQADYDRFQIKDADNSLKNASSKSTGATPEPHEWALILLVVLIVGYLRFPKLFQWYKK